MASAPQEPGTLTVICPGREGHSPRGQQRAQGARRAQVRRQVVQDGLQEGHRGRVQREFRVPRCAGHEPAAARRARPPLVR
ncbi:hypothetical protein MPH_14221, partial [Macrophomina phaseolina MS6]